jgi:hypothetical protein
VHSNAVTDSVKKATAELYLLRGSINIYAGNMRKAFEDFDMSVKLVPSMIQRVKEFQVKTRGKKEGRGARERARTHTTCGAGSERKQKEASLFLFFLERGGEGR